MHESRQSSCASWTRRARQSLQQACATLLYNYSKPTSIAWTSNLPFRVVPNEGPPNHDTDALNKVS